MVNIVEGLDQVMAALDPEIAVPVHNYLRQEGVGVFLQDAVDEFAKDGADGLIVRTV